MVPPLACPHAEALSVGDKKVELRRVLFLRSVFFLPLLLTGGFLTKQDQLAAPVLLPSGDPRHEGPGHDGFGALHSCWWSCAGRRLGRHRGDRFRRITVLTTVPTHYPQIPCWAALFLRAIGAVMERSIGCIAVVLLNDLASLHNQPRPATLSVK